MDYRLFSLAGCLLFCSYALAAEPLDVISVKRIQADVAKLASDRFAGREPGTNGEILTTEFIAEEFKKAGLKPVGSSESFYQPVPLVRVETSRKSTLQAVSPNFTLDIPIEEGFAGTSQTQMDLVEFDAEAIFVGHGITAKEFSWDDYKDVDVKGKIVVLFTNEPPSTDEKYFGGTALTYYGRWTFKYEEAARRGAKACFIIHTTESAGYPYTVVKRLDGMQLKRDPNQPALEFAGWLSRKAGEQLLAKVGKTVEEALEEADTKGFKPYSLNCRLKGKFPIELKSFTTNNVAGMIEGSDPQLKNEAVIFTAHWDHLGDGTAVLGDTIYNGAADNATGCGMIMELARVMAAKKVKPKRSVIFLAVTAEEKGLLGSKYYTEKPLLPLSNTALNLNFDMILPLGVPETIVLTGSERTTMAAQVKSLATKHQFEIETDQRAHLGIFYRSDHFSMARQGVPAFSVAPGMKIQGKPADFAKTELQKFNDKAYHSPQDEMQDSWNFAGFAKLGNFALELAEEVANAESLPEWQKSDEFYKPRKQ